MPLDKITTAPETLEMFNKVDGNGDKIGFPLSRFAAYLLLQGRSIDFSDKSIETWVGLTGNGINAVRIVQIRKPTGCPIKGGYFREQRGQDILE